MNWKNDAILVLSLVAIAVADVLLKYTEKMKFAQAITSWWTLVAIVLYVFQVLGFVYLFTRGSALSYIGIMQTGIYALIVLLSGIFLFGESMTHLQYLGAVLIIAGVILLKI